MQLSTFLTAGLVASFLPMYAARELRIRNNCSFNVTPKWKAGNATNVISGLNMGPGQTWSAFLPELWDAGRLYGQNGACVEPDGDRCTLLECTFSNVGPNQCSISRASGYNIGMSFTWIGGEGCQGGICTNFSCPPQSSECNGSNVGLDVRFCP